ncbi:protein-tyrosine phosphatase-like protein [Mucor lusitanicus]|uniref:Protein-tyrosine phosphatase-like protein n=2 Tax=Mucor circinelloides f. lusitanicus TaxID=29924 RepID=A0A8H4BJH1_MUCCL|nr:protein-tyrosine phosphatase-like protein [Mucor lusitanicus]
MSNTPVMYTTDQSRFNPMQQQPVTTTSTSTLPVLVTSNANPTSMSNSAEAPQPFAKQPKTSTSHPINISWIVPADILSYLSVAQFPKDLDLYDFLDPVTRGEWLKFDDQQYQKFQHLQQTQQLRGNLCLSSCPGKKVRLSGPVRGRAAINRDLDQDFERMKGYGITMLVCCLDDTELEFLGAPWPKYEKAALAHDMKIIRLPMIEGGCPKTLSEVRKAVLQVNKEIYNGHNVLAHCRGGVGRAGLFAGCWLLENLLCRSVERTVYILRERRSSKAIETYAQAEYLIRYAMALNHRLGLPFRATTTTDLSRDIPFESESGSPSIPFIAKLENLVLVDPALIQDDLLPVDEATTLDEALPSATHTTTAAPPPLQPRTSTTAAATAHHPAPPELCTARYHSY